MSIKFTYGGAIFEVGTPKEAAELFRLLRSESAKAQDTRAAVGNVMGASVRTEDEKQQLAIQALVIIRDAKDMGVTSERLTNGLGLKDTRLLGPLGNILKASCKRHNMAPDDVFKRLRTDEGRFWRPGKDIDKAIRVLKGERTKESNPR